MSTHNMYVYELESAVFDPTTKQVTYTWIYKQSTYMTDPSVPNQTFTGTEQQLIAYLGTL